MIDTIIYDLGGVLIDWNPMHVYKDYFENEEQQRFFFEQVCTSDWNEAQDAGRSIAEATAERIQKFPEWEQAIRDYYGRWEEMLGGPIEDSVEVFRQLKDSGNVKLYALTNWSAETFPIALGRYDFLHWFDGRVVSGEEKTRKPFPEFYQILLDRYSVDVSKTVFIDDNARNVAAAMNLGIDSIHFKDAHSLKAELIQRNLL
ncbi:MAG: HAD family phosphatase [Chitinophagaceae bacterium]